MEYIITIDAGTSTFKVVLWDSGGQLRQSYSEEFPLIAERNDFVEADVETYWNVAVKGISHILSKASIKTSDIKVIAISSQGETLINLDREGKPLRNAIVWTDTRSIAEAKIIEDEFGTQTVFETTGQPEVVPTWPATKILWLKRNQPDVFEKTYKYLIVEDYLLYRLTGRYVGEYSVHSSSLWLDIRSKRLWPDMLSVIGVDNEQFPELMDSGQVIGHVSKVASEDTGLSEDTVVVTGLLDQPAGAIGSGNISQGICSETTGTALAVITLLDEPVTKAGQMIPCHCHAIKDKYYLMAWSQTAAIVLQWFKDNFCHEFIEQSQSKGLNVYELLSASAAQVPAGSEGLVMLPHLSGAACPEFNSLARGAWFNISFNHGTGHFIRSIMESVAYMLRKNVDILRTLGIEPTEIRSSGGASRSPLWNSIKADVLNTPVRKVLQSEAASAGAAVIGGVAVGIFRDIAHGCEIMSQLDDPIEPNKTNIAQYEKSYETYLRLYDHLKDLFDDVNT